MTIYYTHKYIELGLGSHELLQLAIGDYIGDKDEGEMLVSNMKRDETREFEGKPYIDGFDKFSISHSENSWAVLIDRRECGLDIQYERSCDYYGIARRFFNPIDAALMREDEMGGEPSAEYKRKIFFRIWTKREAFIKAIGSSVVYEGFPALGDYSSAEYDGRTYFVSSLNFPDAPGLHAAICLDGTEDIDEKLIYKEIYVKE